jgi:RNA polymerase sigma-70 factor, ECF subfamily
LCRRLPVGKAVTESERAAEAALVARAVGGSEEACRRLVERYQRPLYALILRMVREPAVAEELAQDAFVKAFGALGRFDPRWKLSSWLFKIAHNTAIDHLRRREPPSVSLSPPEADGPDYAAALADPDAPDPQRTAERRDLAREIERSMGRLRPEYREVLVLRFEEGLAYEEIAEVLALPLGTVKTHIHRARKELAALLAAAGWGTA